MTVRNMALSSLMMDRIGGVNSSSGPQMFPQPGNGTNQQQTNPAGTTEAIRSFGRALHSALNVINRDRGSIFNALSGNTSDNEVATVNVDNNRTISSMPPRDTTIEVFQVAQAQENEGEEVEAEEREVESGAHTFEIEAGGRVHTFTINVLDTDDNASIQARMAQAINNRDIGITATVETGRNDAGNTTTQLTLAGDRTGTNSAFVVRDVAGDLAESMGVNQATQEAQNARFRVNNGFERVQQTNEVSIAAGATVTLQGEGTAEITFQRNTDAQVEAVTNLVNTINDAMRNTRAADGRGSERFIRDLAGMNQTFSNSLSRVGIDVQLNGQLRIDEARLERAAESGELGRLFENRQVGFAGRVDRIASNAANTNFYQNAPAPVSFNLPNNFFDFGNAFNTWNMVSMFG